MPIMPQQTGLYEGLKLSELKARVLDRLKQKALSYDRYSETSILNALIDTEVELARITRCLRGFAFIVLKNGYAQYRPPSNMLLLDKAFFYQSNTSYYELQQKNRAWMDRHQRGWRTVEGDPVITFPGDNYGNLRKIGFYPRPNVASTFALNQPTGEVISGTGDTLSFGGTQISFTDSGTGAYETNASISPSNNVTGMNSVVHATVCTDSEGRTLTDLGVAVGMMAINVTDGSKGQISAISGSTFTVTLTGGTNNTWAVGDSFQIMSGEYGVVTSWDDDEQYIFTTDYGVITGVTQAHNVFLEYYRRPSKLSFSEQYPEVPPELHQYMPDNAVYLLKRGAQRGSADFNDAQEGRSAFLSGMGGYVDLDDKAEDSPFIDWNL